MLSRLRPHRMQPNGSHHIARIAPRGKPREAVRNHRRRQTSCYGSPAVMPGRLIYGGSTRKLEGIAGGRQDRHDRSCYRSDMGHPRHRTRTHLRRGARRESHRPNECRRISRSTASLLFNERRVPAGQLRPFLGLRCRRGDATPDQRPALLCVPNVRGDAPLSCGCRSGHRRPSLRSSN